MIRGYDLSQHQAITPVLDDTSFIVLRASIGTTKDTRYDQHYAAARAAGIVVMAYHYGFPADRAPIAEQAATFLEAAKDADFLWLDQEETGFSDAQAQEFIDAVRVIRPCGLYHSASGFGGVVCDAKWVADWRDASETAGYPRTADGSKEFPGWTLWQYDGGGADGLDNNYWNPDRPIAALLRKGYVTQADYADVEGQLALSQRANDALTALSTEFMTLSTELMAKVDALTAANADLGADLAEAPAIERERIAQAEAERVRAL